MDTTAYVDIPLYTAYKKDSDCEYLDGSKYRYVMKFEKDWLAMNTFWSVTTYRLAGHFHNSDPIRRYLIHSPSFSSLQKDDVGSMTIYLQRESPGREKENNWLPPPKGLFFIVVRIYLPFEQPVRLNHEDSSLKKAVKARWRYFFFLFILCLKMIPALIAVCR